MDKKEEIVQNASALFAEKGYYGVGLKELLDSCGVPKGSFYYYFPNGKIDLLNHVLEFCYGKMVNGIQKNYFNHNTLLECFESMINGLAKHLLDNQHFASLTLSMIGIESAYLDPSIHEKCKEIYISWQQLYVDQFLKFGYEKEEAVERAQSIFGIIHGALISSWIKQSNEDLLLVKNTLKYLIK